MDTAKGQTERIELTRAQQAVARRTAESKATAPDWSLTVDLPGAPSTAAAVHAASRALRDFPLFNGAYRDGGWERYSRVNVGIVLTVGDGIAVPVIFDADTKDRAAIDAEITALREQAVAGTLKAPALAGATFTVYALPVRSFTPILIPPQAALLAVGTAALTLVADHRIVYGEPAAAFLNQIAAAL